MVLVKEKEMDEMKKINEWNIGNTWLVTENEFDFDLHTFIIEGLNDQSYYGKIYPYDLEQQDQLRNELDNETFDLNEWGVEWL